MKNVTVFAALVLGVGVLGWVLGVGVGQVRADDPEARPGTTQPAQQLLLEIDGAVATVEAGRWTTTMVGGREVRLRVTPTGVRRLDVGFVSFDYLDEFAFEYDDTDPTVTMWTLDGSNAVIMLYQLAEGIHPPGYVEQVAGMMAASYGEWFHAEAAAPAIELDGKQLTGRRLIMRLEVAGEAVWLTQDLYAFEAGGVGGCLILQDAPPAIDEQTPEFEAMLARLEQSLTWARP